MNGIKRFFKNRQDEKNNLRKKQEICKHNFVTFPFKLDVKSQFNLIEFLGGGVSRLSIETEVLVCTKCGKQIGVDVDV